MEENPVFEYILQSIRSVFDAQSSFTGKKLQYSRTEKFLLNLSILQIKDCARLMLLEVPLLTFCSLLPLVARSCIALM